MFPAAILRKARDYQFRIQQTHRFIVARATECTMGDRWVEIITALQDRGHLGLQTGKPDSLSKVATLYLTAGITRALLPVIVARGDEAKFWIERALPDPSAVRGGEFGLRFVPVPPKLAPAGLFPILESVSEAAVYAEDRGMRGVCVISSLCWNALQLEQDEVAIQSETAIGNLPFVYTILCVSNAAGGENARNGFRRLHRHLLEETPTGLEARQAELVVYR